MLTLQFKEKNLNTASLTLNEKRTSRVSRLSPCVVNITGIFEPERARVEDFIKTIYKEHYGADIQVEYPVLMSVRDQDDNILAAVGFRYADKEPLFLEQYTKHAIDQILSCERQDVVEVGNLASAGQGASVFLFAALASYLNSKNIRFATITGTDYLHSYFSRIGLQPRKLCDADIASVTSDGQSWGSYYDTHPRVLVGSVETGVKRLKSLLGAEFTEIRPRLFPRLHFKQNEQ